MSAEPVRVLVVDGSSVYRRLVRSVVEELPGAAVVGTASDSRLALEKLRSLSPDLVAIDFGVLSTHGGDALLAFLESPRRPRTLLFVEQELRAGIAETVDRHSDRLVCAEKPRGADPGENRVALLKLLEREVRACGSRGGVNPAPSPTSAESTSPGTRRLARKRFAGRKRPEAICIGVSTGGPEALHVLLPGIPSDFPIPILVVQHMPAAFTRSLAEELDRRCPLRVCEATDGQAIAGGAVYIAPGGRQMKTFRSGEGVAIRITDDPPEHNCRPAVDYLFRSAAEAFDGAVVGVVMTGMGTDGADGCRLLKERGAAIVCQEARSCVVYGMPRAVIERGLADRIADLHDLATTIREFSAGSASC